MKFHTGLCSALIIKVITDKINNITYEEVYVPLDKYLTFGGENYRIADEYIKSIRPINEEEIKQFEKI